MNKRLVEEYMEPAYHALKECDVARQENGEGSYTISKDFRGKIAAYGAAITMGNLRSGTAFYSEQGGAESERQNLMRAIYRVLHQDTPAERIDEAALFRYVTAHQGRDARERIFAAATALKLAMNLYILVEK